MKTYNDHYPNEPLVAKFPHLRRTQRARVGQATQRRADLALGEGRADRAGAGSGPSPTAPAWKKLQDALAAKYDTDPAGGGGDRQLLLLAHRRAVSSCR